MTPSQIDDAIQRKLSEKGFTEKDIEAIFATIEGAYEGHKDKSFDGMTLNEEDFVHVIFRLSEILLTYNLDILDTPEKVVAEMETNAKSIIHTRLRAKLEKCLQERLN